MLTLEDLETLILTKKREIENEKTQLGLSPPPKGLNVQITTGNNLPEEPNKHVVFKEHVLSENQNKPVIKKGRNVCDHHDEKDDKEESSRNTLYKLEESIPPDLERYIRRYIGLPVMLKAGEYSPNNPLLRGDRAAGGDALLGLGEYERRRNTLRKIQQAQYRQYLDQQAQKKQEAKEEAERERLEREEKERLREERERQLLLERERYSPERRRASVSSVPITNAFVQTTKVDTAVQVDAVTSPLSVAVQTDDLAIYTLSQSPCKLTQAERELSPRTVAEPKGSWTHKWDTGQRRRSYGDFDERSSTVKKTNRDKLVSDLRHTYMPSIFDADAIQMRNLQAEEEAAARRQYYQQELKNQILEQQRIREERKSREKMLEQAEMRRLEEQLRMLRVAQDTEKDKQQDISTAMRDHAKEYETKRTALQREIDLEQRKFLRSTSQPTASIPKRHTNTSKSDTQPSKLPFFYPQSEKTFQPIEKKPYSFNIPENSVFSSNYDVDSYLRKNLNFRDKIDLEIENIGNHRENIERIERALVHEPKDRKLLDKSKEQDDIVSIPVLRNSPRLKNNANGSSSNLSDAMKKIDDKWKVPAVQKNILKSLPNEDGKNISILTQLGSIRRQLQLEQLKLDKMLSKDES